MSAKLDPQAFAQGVRRAYPGAFDDIKDDYALTKAVIQEHPEFANEVDFGPQHPNKIDYSGGILDKIGALEGGKLNKFVKDKTGIDIAPNDEIPASGVIEPNMIGSIAAGGATAAKGLNAAAEQSAKLGPLGGIVGVPALIGAMASPDTETKAGLFAPAGAAIKASGTLAKALTQPETKQVAADLIQATAAIPKNDTLAVLKDPSLIDRAKSVAEATKDYVKAIPGLKHVSDSLSEVLGKVNPKLPDYENLVDTIKASGAYKSDPQEALNGVQAVNNILRHREFPKDPQSVRAYLEVKNQFLDALDEAAPKFKDASKALREAHVAEQFSSIFPRNKNLSTNVLRTLLATREGAAGLAMLANGETAGAGLVISALSASPKAVGKGIQLASKLGPLAEDAPSALLGKLDDAGMAAGEGLPGKATGQTLDITQALADKASDAVRSAPKLLGYDTAEQQAQLARVLNSGLKKADSLGPAGYDSAIQLPYDKTTQLAQDLTVRRSNAYRELNDAQKALENFMAANKDSLKYKQYADEAKQLQKSVDLAKRKAVGLSLWLKDLKP